MEAPWPSLEYFKWIETYQTLHRWVQIVGKLRLCKTPWANHSWNSTLYVSSRGLTTSAIPLGDRNLTVEFDFIDHFLNFQDSMGKHFQMPLGAESVASFFTRFKQALDFMQVNAKFDPAPNELPDCVPFSQDLTHASYHPEEARNCFEVLVRVSNVMQDYRTKFVGKSSPVHFFWGSFDLAVSRFSGGRAPEHPGGFPHLSNLVAREAYSHEVMSCGFWPGNDMFPHAAFYSYIYPAPEGFPTASIHPGEAFYHKEMGEFILPYEIVRTSINPEEMIMRFFDSSYQAAANLAHWDRDLLEVSPFLDNVKEWGSTFFDASAIAQ